MLSFLSWKKFSVDRFIKIESSHILPSSLNTVLS